MFGQLRAAKGHVKSVRPSKIKKQKNPTKQEKHYASFKFPISGYCLLILF